MVGMALSVQWIVWVAVVLLIAAFFLRFHGKMSDSASEFSETVEDSE